MTPYEVLRVVRTKLRASHCRAGQPSSPISARARGVVCLPPQFYRKYLNHVFAGQDILDASNDMLRLERLTIVLADMARRDEPGLGPQVASELAAEVVLDDYNPLALAEDVGDFLHMEGNQKVDLEVVGGDALLVQALDRLHEDAPGRTPADERHLGLGWPFKFRRRHVIEHGVHLARALVHHLFSPHRVREDVANQYTVLVVLVRAGH